MYKKNIFVTGGALGAIVFMIAYVAVGLFPNSLKAYADQTVDGITMSAHDTNNNQPVMLLSGSNNLPAGDYVAGAAANKNGDNPLLLVNGKQYGVPSGVVSSTKQKPTIQVEGSTVYINGVKAIPEN